MSFLAKLEIDGETMNVLEFQCNITQETDKSGKPSSDVNGGVVRIIVESSKTTTLWDWGVSHALTKNGKLTFFRRDATSKMRELEFNEAYCISYEEKFLSDSNSPMQIEFSISAKEIIMNGSKYTRNWPMKF
jgi:Hemolysin coregulated protein Hcp (TssD)